jgi:ABC transporter substrate binding protein
LQAKAANQTIPIVFMIGGDPVQLGVVRSLNRPGANLTDIASLLVETISKRLRLLHELVPAIDLIAVLVNSANPAAEPITRELQIAARVLGVRLLILNASSQSDIEAAFTTLVRGAGGLMIDAEAFFVGRRDQVLALAARAKGSWIVDHEPPRTTRRLQSSDVQAEPSEGAEPVGFTRSIPDRNFELYYCSAPTRERADEEPTRRGHHRSAADGGVGM